MTPGELQTVRSMVEGVHMEIYEVHLVDGFATGRQLSSWMTRLHAALAALGRYEKG